MDSAVPLAAGLLLGWITAPLVRALVAKEQRQNEGGVGAGPPAALARAAAAPAAAHAPAPAAAAAPAAAPPTATPSSSSSSSASSTTTTSAAPPAPPPKRQHPSLEHARASAGTAKPPPCPPFANNGGDTAPPADAPADHDAAAAPPAPTLDLSTPQAIASLFSNGGLSPLVPAHDGRPLVAFDLEATGLSVTRDRVVEIAAVKVFPDGRVQVKGPQRLNPGREAALRMPAQVVEIHGLTPAMLAKEPRWEDVAEDWRDFLRGCDLAGYNALRYDVPLLRAEFRRAGDPNFPPHGVRVLDGFRVFSRMAPRSLPAAVRVFCGGAAMTGHHSALADAAAALAVLRGQLAAYPGLPRDAGELAQWCASPDDPGRQLTCCGRIVWDDGASTREIEAFTAAFEEHAAAAAAAAGPTAPTAAATAATPQAPPLQLPPPPPPPEATAVFAFGKYRDIPLKVVAEEDREYLLWLIARREALSEEAAAIVAAALRGDFPRKGPSFAPWLEAAMARLAPTAGGGGVIASAGAGTEAAEVARMTGLAAPPPAAAAAAATDADAAADATAPLPPLVPPAPELPPVSLLGMPSTMCHLPGDFEREAPAAGNYHASTARYGRNRRSGNQWRRRGGGGGAGAGAGAAAEGEGGDEGLGLVDVRSVGVQVPEPVVRGWDEARKAYLSDGAAAGEAAAAAGAAAGAGAGAALRAAAAAEAAAVAAAAAAPLPASPPPPLPASPLPSSPLTVPAPVPPACSAPPPPPPPPPPSPRAFLGGGGGGDSWASSPHAPQEGQQQQQIAPAAAAGPRPAAAADAATDDVTTPDPPSPPPPALGAGRRGPGGGSTTAIAADAPPLPIEQAALDWGRYKGRPLAEVAAEDPAFLRWVVECLGASPWDRAVAAAALRAAGEDDGLGEEGDGRASSTPRSPRSPSSLASSPRAGGGGEGQREEEEQREEEVEGDEAEAEEQQCQAAASE